MSSNVSNAQRYINLSVDNDLYFSRDWYYSSGIFVSTGKLKIAEDQEERFPKTYVHWTLGQEIYTPSRRYTTDVSQFDYPFGGWLYLEHTIENIKVLFLLWGFRLRGEPLARLPWRPIFRTYITIRF